jgi:hypothetical protein
VSNSKMRRYLEFLQSFEPPIKLRWQSSKDPSFKIADYLSRPNTVGDPPILNKNIPGNIEEDIELRCEKLSTATNTVDNYILLMDFLLEQSDSSVEKLDNCSVYIDGDSNICTGNPDNCTILKSHDSYVTPGLPDKEAEPTASTMSCETKNVDSCNLRDDASDKVVSCEPSFPNKKLKVREDVDHISTAQLQSGNCRPAIPATQRTIDIGVSKTDTDVICTEDEDFTDNNFESWKNIRLTSTRKGQDRNQPLLLSSDEVFSVNKIKTRSMSAQQQLSPESSIEDVLSYGVNSESEIRSRLNLYNQKDRFLNYILI